MKAQLVKREDRWDLYHPERGDKIASSAKSTLHKLSIKNCQSIENGYDLDELADNFSWNYQSDPNYGDTINIFKAGFQKAIELLGDKKYTEIDLYRVFLINSAGNNDTLKKFFDENVLPMFHLDYEWDVTFNPSEKDVNGCLILHLQNKHNNSVCEGCGGKGYLDESDGYDYGKVDCPIC